ncbi:MULTISPECIES: addiction module antidote protein [unclassified Adlercreutzia]|uniref:addiction module antidote protein n=1 Tax=unclassified Adlercreutzia TaxID=2636013 RepID=UPI001F14C31B|nr:MULTISPECIES: addiction module antidote protein [unclassified Adlercreutzia]
MGTKMKKATKWDASEYLETEADVAAYLKAALEDGDTSVVAAALGDIARAKGMTQLAKETGITRDGLYKALSPTGNPSFDTVQKVVKALGLRLDVATSA